MTIYIVFLVLNLLGMGFLFYAYEQQRNVNTEFLKNAILNNAVLDILNKKVEELEGAIAKLETEKK